MSSFFAIYDMIVIEKLGDIYGKEGKKRPRLVEKEI